MNQNWILKHSLLLLILPFIGCVKREQTFDFEKQYLLALDGERIVVDGKPFSGTLFQPWVIDNDTLEKIRYEIDLYKGVPHGKLKMYYSDGILSLSAAYKNGNLDGPYEEYIEDGQLSIVGSFNEGQQNGVWTFYDNEGNIEFQGTFNNGVLQLSAEQKLYYIITQALNEYPENSHRETNGYIQGFMVYGISLFSYNTEGGNSPNRSISSISFRVSAHDFSGDFYDISSTGRVIALSEKSTCGYRDCSNYYDYSIVGRWIDEEAGDGDLLLNISKNGKVYINILGDGDWRYSESIKVSSVQKYLELYSSFSKKYTLSNQLISTKKEVTIDESTSDNAKQALKSKDVVNEKASDDFHIVQTNLGLRTIDSTKDPQAWDMLSRAIDRRKVQLYWKADFAFNYEMVTYGVGTGCQQGVMVDIRNGKIYGLPINCPACPYEDTEYFEYNISSHDFVTTYCENFEVPIITKYVWDESREEFIIE